MISMQADFIEIYLCKIIKSLDLGPLLLSCYLGL
jgi:hypothetical protein